MADSNLQPSAMADSNLQPSATAASVIRRLTVRLPLVAANKIGRFGAKRVERSYAFEEPNVPSSASYLKLGASLRLDPPTSGLWWPPLAPLLPLSSRLDPPTSGSCVPPHSLQGVPPLAALLPLCNPKVADRHPPAIYGNHARRLSLPSSTVTSRWATPSSTSIVSPASTCALGSRST